MIKEKTRKKPLSEKATDWIGSVQSLAVHVFLMLGIFALGLLGLPLNRILLILTTFLSIEAIFLAIFIQMSVNRTTDTIEEIGVDNEEDLTNDKQIAVTLHTIESRLNRLQNDLKKLKEKGLM